LSPSAVPRKRLTDAQPELDSFMQVSALETPQPQRHGLTGAVGQVLRTRLLRGAIGRACYRTVYAVYGYLFRRLILVRSVLYDARRFVHWSFALKRPRTREQVRAFLTMRYHSLEKGLALPDPRPGFAADKVGELVQVLRAYEGSFGCDDLVRVCFGVLSAYRRFNGAHGIAVETVDWIVDELSRKHADIGQDRRGGTFEMSRSNLDFLSSVDFDRFIRSRHSIRVFSPAAVDPASLEQAVRWAQRTPSVCNRQSCRVHVYTRPEQIKRLLSYQTGNRGFGHAIPVLIVITSDLQCFAGPGERYQGWIDGGMFSMSLILGLHAQGLGTCCLNWSVTLDIDQSMRRHGDIPDNELVIMMLGVGHIPEKLSVAQSTRRNLDEVMSVH
jgi:nitroreductase